MARSVGLPETTRRTFYDYCKVLIQNGGESGIRTISVDTLSITYRLITPRIPRIPRLRVLIAHHCTYPGRQRRPRPTQTFDLQISAPTAADIAR